MLKASNFYPISAHEPGPTPSLKGYTITWALHPHQLIADILTTCAALLANFVTAR